ncbi:hypothetical protein IGI04_005197 [Brassica rapa subsp. trilocularis]|uniref:Uncharacterized protein n=1 Tax=Brassica rapa subsp. trilocularis TaxID=1813537 RepID=A0ABQ7NDB0_BRACM|nr:hypothetical protein IGI04_005197 [Brassica rapa subsp. trilocularis]
MATCRECNRRRKPPVHRKRYISTCGVSLHAREHLFCRRIIRTVLEYNEYTVYDLKLTSIRFLVEVKYKEK